MGGRCQLLNLYAHPALRATLSRSRAFKANDKRSPWRGPFRRAHQPLCPYLSAYARKRGSVLGFRQFLLRGLDNVKGEWTLVTMAWNVKRMFALRAA